MSNIIFLDKDKEGRAKHIYQLITGKRASASQGDEYNKIRLAELAKDEGANTKDADEYVLFIYEKLGGTTRTIDQVKAIKERVKKVKAFAKAEKEDEEGVSADDNGTDDDE